MTATMATTAAPIGLYEHLKDDLGYLKLTRAAEILPGRLDRARAEQLTHAQFLAELLAEEAAATRNRRMAARLRFAHFPARRTLDEFDFDFQPSVDPKLVADLASLRFVAEGHPLLLLGQPGCGKSHCETGLGDPGACRRTIPGRRGLTRSLIGHRTCALAWSCRPMPSRASLVRLAPVTARRSRVDRWQAGVGNQGRPQRVTGRPRACLRVDLSPRLPAPARPTERWPDQKPVRPRA